MTSARRIRKIERVRMPPQTIQAKQESMGGIVVRYWVQVLAVVIGVSITAPGFSAPLERNSFVIHEMGWAPVVVLDMTMPYPVVGESGECRVIIRLDDSSETEVNILSCDERFQGNTLRATQAWVIRSLDASSIGGSRRAFRARFVYDDRRVELHLNEQWLASPVDQRPAGVRTSSLMIDRTAVPRYPKKLQEAAKRTSVYFSLRWVGPVGRKKSRRRNAASCSQLKRGGPPSVGGGSHLIRTVSVSQRKPRCVCALRHNNRWSSA